MVKYIFNTLLCVVQIVFIANSGLIAQTSPLTFSEVMFYPSVTNGEFVEIYNTSATETINLSGYKFKYYTSSNNNLISVEGGMFLKPASFAVILQGNHDFENSVYKTIIPSSAIILKTSSNNFGSSGMANTSSREISLIDQSGNIVDTYNYSADNSAGYSDEKIILSKDNDQYNWGNSKRLHGTPGIKNSISPVDYDLSVSFLKVIPVNPVQGDTLLITLKVSNIGRVTADNYDVNLYCDMNRDSIGSIDERIFLEQFINLVSGDSLIIEIQYYFETEGNYSFIAEVIFSKDEKVGNNSVIKSIYISEKPADYNDVIVNEIMYAPTGDEPEWIELYNRSERKTNLKNWRIGDNSASIVISNSDYYLEPNEFLVISKDISINNYYDITSKLLIRSLPTLNNGGDDVIVRNNVNKTIDSLKYIPIWGGNANGKSLERISIDSPSISQTNWGSCEANNKSTPGRINSISKKKYDLAIKSLLSKSKFIEIGKSLELIATIKNIGREIAENFLVRLYSDYDFNSIIETSEFIEGKVISRLDTNSSIPISFIVNEFKEGINQFIVVIEYEHDEYTDNNSSHYRMTGVEINEQRNDLVINEIMYAPVSPEPEWIEIFNRSDKEIDLKGYQIADDVSKSKVISSSLIIRPGEYFVITRDSLIHSIHKDLQNCVVASFPSLNNNSDRIVLLDSLDRIIDSLVYNFTWGGSDGKSLERISSLNNSIESSNWRSSLSRYNSTPGKINSVTPKDYDLSFISFGNNISYATVGEKITLNLIFENRGNKDAHNYIVKLFRDKNNDSIYEDDELIEQYNQTLLKSLNKRTVEFQSDIIVNGKNTFIAVIGFKEDQFFDNNMMIFNINGVIINELRSDLVINEIMYAPASPEPEWIEIYNRSNKDICLTGYHIADEASKLKIIYDSLIIKPKEYYVIAKDSSLFSLYSGLYKNVVIANIPSLNNTGDKIVLTDSLNRVIDSLNYKSSWGGTNGKSLERCDVNISSTDSTNWKTSILQSGGTPGKINSVSKKNYDGAITEVKFIPEYPLVGEITEIEITAINVGVENINAKLNLYEMLNDNQKQLIEESESLYIKSGETISHKFNHRTKPIYTKQSYEVLLAMNNDDDLTNNIKISVLYPGYPPGSILLNEIMYNPVNGEPEWIELYNTSEYDIDLENWSITDVLTNPVKTKIKVIIFPKNSFLVITKDTSIINYHKSIPCNLLVNNFANLNNDVDGVVIKDYWGTTIDSIWYEKSWGGENGKSLERKSLLETSTLKTNWSSSKDIELSTPGRINSITQKNYDLAVKEITMLPCFPIDNEEVNFSAMIINYGLFTAGNFSIKFYHIIDSDTLLFDEVSGNNLPSCDSVVVFSLNRKTIKESLAIQCRVIFNEDEELSNNILIKEFNTGYKKGSILISEIMYNPYEGESEWIEIFNNSGEIINLNNWQVSDVVSPVKTKICSKDIFIEPGEYAILTPDTNKFPYYPPKKFFQTKFGTLGNTNDGVIIYDLRGQTIDSVFYYSKWGGEKGYSLERINYDLPANDSSNWATSLSIHGATPGISNSISNIPSYNFSSIVINEIMYEPSSFNTEFIEFYNPTDDSIQIGGWCLRMGETKKLKLSSTYKIMAPKNFIILAKDSSLFPNYSNLTSNFSSVLINNSLSLSNSGTSLALKDIYGNNIDSVYYKPSWHNKNIINKQNRTLERINPIINSNDELNWSTSVSEEGATPCCANSIFTELKNGTSKVNVTPNPFSPDNDGFEDFTTINLSLSSVYSQVKIRIFDSKGRLMRTLIHYSPMASNNSIIYDGLDDNSRPLRIGIYILLIEAVNENGNIETFKLPLVSARKL